MERPDPASIPDAPGVYIYRDANGRPLYVGKARILRRRVISYFRPEGLAPKTVAMLAKARSLEYIATNTEKEALLLEAHLIKKHRPPYNIVLRDDKQYALFRLNTKIPFPRLEVVRGQRRDGAMYFGPFTSALAARETWRLLHRAFAIRRCSDRAMKNRVRPCLYHYMGQCPAPCMGLISQEEYARSIRSVLQVLSGDAGALLGELRQQMEEAARDMEFEKAAELRDQIRAVEQTVERQAAVLPGRGDMDAIGLYPDSRGLALGLISIRQGSVTEGRAFYWAGLELEDAQELMATFIAQYYTRVMPPPRIVLPWLPEDGESFGRGLLEQVLGERRNGSVRLAQPRDQADNRLVDMASANAREEARRRNLESTDDLLESVQSTFGLASLPRRLECVDVSHTGGRNTRVGLVVFVDGEPSRGDYRAYAMPDSDDDFATLHAWVSRRLESGPPWPDLLLIDGGKGQLSAVERALAENGQKNLFSIAAIAKARDGEGHADRRAGNVADRIFVPGRSNPLPLKAGSRVLLFLQNLRDATHAFAIGSHRKARGRAAMSAELMRLPGVGPATARLLWEKFGSIQAMASADESELRKIPGIGAARAAMLRKKLENFCNKGAETRSRRASSPQN